MLVGGGDSPPPKRRFKTTALSHRCLTVPGLAAVRICSPACDGRYATINRLGMDLRNEASLDATFSDGSLNGWRHSLLIGHFLA